VPLKYRTINVRARSHGNGTNPHDAQVSL
jgi:hypothetical protein